MTTAPSPESESPDDDLARAAEDYIAECALHEVLTLVRAENFRGLRNYLLDSMLQCGASRDTVMQIAEGMGFRPTDYQRGV